MSDWTSAADLRAQARKLWQRGVVLHSALCEERETQADSASDTEADSGRPVFPHRLKLRTPRSTELAPHFDEVRAWVREIDTLPHVRIEHRTLRHRDFGNNTLPSTVWLDTPEAADALVGKSGELIRFRKLAARIHAHDARLTAWVTHYPHRVLELAEVLTSLLHVHSHLLDMQGSGRYLRELDVPGVHTKFIETHLDTLAAWLDLTLPQHLINASHTGRRGFARRYGFRDRPERLRLRSCDETLPLIRTVSHDEDATDPDLNLATADVTLDVASIALLQPAHRHVLIVENEINYLSLPTLPSTIAVFGAGYGLAAFGSISWMQQRQVHYWGDIDTHGFAILNELRTHLPEARSVLMDRRTLLEHRAFWGTEPKPARRNLLRLTASEQQLYRELVDSTHGDSIRLEQERLPYDKVVTALRERTH